MISRDYSVLYNGEKVNRACATIRSLAMKQTQHELERDPMYEPKPIPGYPGYLAHPDGSIFKGRRRIKARLTPSWRYKVRLRDAEGKTHQRDLAEVILETFKGPRPSPHHRAVLGGNNGKFTGFVWEAPPDAPQPAPPMDYPEGTPPDLAALLDELRTSKRRVRVRGRSAWWLPASFTQTVGADSQLVLSPGGRIDPRDITFIQTLKGKALWGEPVCEMCGETKGDVDYCINPYYADVNNDLFYQWLCSECYQACCDDI